MQNLRQFAATTFLTLILSVPAFAGDILMPGITGEMSTPGIAGDMQFPVAFALDILRSALS